MPRGNTLKQESFSRFAEMRRKDYQTDEDVGDVKDLVIRAEELERIRIDPRPVETCINDIVRRVGLEEDIDYGTSKNEVVVATLYQAAKEGNLFAIKLWLDLHDRQRMDKNNYAAIVFAKDLQGL